MSLCTTASSTCVAGVLMDLTNLPGPCAYVVDDDDASRESIGALLSAMNIPARSYDSASGFLSELPSEPIGCLITDVRMPHMSGIELVRQLTQVDPDMPVIVVSGYIDVADTVKAMKLGAVTVLTKPFEVAQLRDAVNQSFNLVRERRAQARRREALKGTFGELNDGELGVLHCLDKGMLNKVAAARLGVSIRTVENRRRRILELLSADSVATVLHLLNEARSLGVSLPTPFLKDSPPSS